MRHPNEIAKDEASMSTLVELTSVFEGIASMRIAQTKNQVLESTKFFDELWKIYTQLRVDSLFSFGREESDKNKVILDKELYIIITAEGGFSGDIDQKLVHAMLEAYDKEKNDIIVIGHHGAMQLSQRGVSFRKYYKLPSKDKNINVAPIIREVQEYKKCSVFYQQYISLMNQEVKRISLSMAVRTAGLVSDKPDEVISEANYIFEPTSFAVAAHLERSMMKIALGQLILQSKLAQYASRFRAMSASHQRADEEKSDLHLAYNRARRGVKDERLKEIINGMKKSKAGAAA
ncbi:F0F1 ATP synthase subunit gamma [Candidatus Saccharibacteria bacterium]|nr:MAG: F0F1 ATP synthase subunit gamma [Candidatus Saccharibacteria bacterium]